MHTSVHAHPIALAPKTITEGLTAYVEETALAVGRAPIRIMIVVEHEVVRLGIRTALATENDFVLVDEVVDALHVMTQVALLSPDIVLLDVCLGAVDGLGIAQQLLLRYPQTRVVVFTACAEDDFLLRASRIGVHGYLQQSIPLQQLFSALRAVRRGERVLNDPRAVTQVLGAFSRLARENERTRSGLSELELALLHSVSYGCSNKEIAARYYWSEVTVKRKMQEIYRKLAVTDRTQAVATALRMGLL